MTKDRVEEIGAMFRFITPILVSIGIFGAGIIFNGQNEIRNSLDNINAKIDHFVADSYAYRQNIERRVSRMESIYEQAVNGGVRSKTK